MLVSAMGLITMFCIGTMFGIAVRNIFVAAEKPPTLADTQATLDNIKENLDRIGVNLKEFDNK